MGSIIIISNCFPAQPSTIAGIDVSAGKNASEKAEGVRTVSLQIIEQIAQLNHPDARVSIQVVETNTTLLSKYAESYWGIGAGDTVRFARQFWEVDQLGKDWSFFQGSFSMTNAYAGREQILFWQNGQGELYELAEELRARLKNTWQRGNVAWGKTGVVISQMGNLAAAIYTGEIFQQNVAAIIPKKPEHLSAIWAFCSSPEFALAVRKIDQKLNVTNATLVKVPFDLEYWQKIAEANGPLTEPHSKDPTQWLFRGQPFGSSAPLQIAVARLLAYHWPQQQTDALDRYATKEGIVCLPPVAGEQPATERLRVLLAAAYGETWSHNEQERLLAATGFVGASLDTWLRDGFFAQHCALFHNRPFIWHIWDGRKDGFSALVNYHKLDAARLDMLIYTYLGTWIATQRAERDAGVAGADGRLIAALELKKKLEAIREGEPDYDIFVRWKPLHQQPIGWNPDLNDGVRLNIRPFVTAGVLRSKFTINWNKDRGTNPDGSERINDKHYTRAVKWAARQAEDQQL